MRELISELNVNGFKFTTLRYEDLSNWAVGEAVIKEAIHHWEPLGFLQGIDDEVKKRQISVAYDNMAHDLLFENDRVVKLDNRYNYNCRQDDKDKYSPEFTAMVFPIIRRVITKIDNFNYDKFLDALEKFSFVAINYDEYDFEECDVEAEFCAMLSLLIIELFKNTKNKK